MATAVFCGKTITLVENAVASCLVADIVTCAKYEENIFFTVARNRLLLFIIIIRLRSELVTGDQNSILPDQQR